MIIVWPSDAQTFVFVAELTAEDFSAIGDTLSLPYGGTFRHCHGDIASFASVPEDVPHYPFDIPARLRPTYWKLKRSCGDAAMATPGASKWGADIAKKFEQLVENGIKELNNSALKHEVKPLIDEFRGIKTRSYRFSNIVGKISFDPAFLARVK